MTSDVRVSRSGPVRRRRSILVILLYHKSKGSRLALFILVLVALLAGGVVPRVRAARCAVRAGAARGRCGRSKRMSVPTLAFLGKYNNWTVGSAQSSATFIPNATPVGTTVILVSVFGLYNGGVVVVSDTQANHYVQIEQRINITGDFPATLTLFAVFSPKALSTSDTVMIAFPPTESAIVEAEAVQFASSSDFLDGGIGVAQGNSDTASVSALTPLVGGDLVCAVLAQGPSLTLQQVIPPGSVFHTFASYNASLFSAPLDFTTLQTLTYGAIGAAPTPSPPGPFAASFALGQTEPWILFLIPISGTLYPVEPESVLMNAVLQSATLRM